MATITKFEDLEIWQRARTLCKNISIVTDAAIYKQDFGLRQQMLNSSGSTMDNISEGFERDGKKEFVQFLYIAKASAGELRSQLHRSFDKKFVDEKTYNELILDCTELSKQIGNFIKYLMRSDFNGTKYKNRDSKVETKN